MTEFDRQLAEFRRLAGEPKRVRRAQVTIASEVVEFPLCTGAGLTATSRRLLTAAGWRYWWWHSHNNLRRGWAKILQLPAHARPLSYWWRHMVEDVGLIVRLDAWLLSPHSLFCGRYPQHCNVGGALLANTFQLKKHVQVLPGDIPEPLENLLAALVLIVAGNCRTACALLTANGKGNPLVMASDGMAYVLQSRRPPKVRSPYTDPAGFFEDAAKLECRLVKAGS